MLPSRNSMRGSNRKKSSQPDLREVVSRKEIGAVTINMSGRSGLGLTPKYKIDMVKDYLQTTTPDVIILQDAIDHNDITMILDDIGSGGLYEWYFRPDHSKFSPEENLDEYGENTADSEEVECVTGIIWNKEKYLGTPLKVDDHRLSQYRYGHCNVSRFIASVIAE